MKIIHRKRKMLCLLLIIMAGIMVWVLYEKGMPPTKWLPPCMFYKLTGFSCPGCGCTRAVEALIEGNIMACIRYNPIIIYGVVCWSCDILSRLFEWICRSWKKKFPSRKKEGNLINVLTLLHSPKARRYYLYGSIVMLLGFGLLRCLSELWCRLH